MGTVVGFTAQRMLEIENASVTGGVVNGQGNLILTTRAGSSIDAGRVKGDPGENEPVENMDGTVSSTWTYGKPDVTLSDGTVVSAFLPLDDTSIVPGASVVVTRTSVNTWTITGVRNSGPRFLRQIELAPSAGFRWYDAVAGDPLYVNETVEGASLQGRYGPAYVTRTYTGWILATGLFRSTTSLPSGTIVTTFPLGFRPSFIQRFSNVFGANYVLHPDGRLVLDGAAGVGTLISLANIKFNVTAPKVPISGFMNGWGPAFGLASSGVDSLGWAFAEGYLTGGATTNNTLMATSPTAGDKAPGAAFTKHQPTASPYSSIGAIYISNAGLLYNTANASNAEVSLNGSLWDPLALNVPWVSPVLLNGWANYLNGYSTTGFYKRDDGLVALRGFVRFGTAGSGVFILPEGCRPKTRIAFASLADPSGMARLDITPGGMVYAVSGSTNWFSLEGIMFAADH